MSNSKPIKKLFEKFVRNECSKTEIDKVIDHCKTARSNHYIPTIERVLLLTGERPFLTKERTDQIYNYIISFSG